jgi:hypothetical protein
MSKPPVIGDKPKDPKLAPTRVRPAFGSSTMPSDARSSAAM